MLGVEDVGICGFRMLENTCGFGEWLNASVLKFELEKLTKGCM